MIGITRRSRLVDQELLIDTLKQWPGQDHDKGGLRALVLRLRIEQVVRDLPSSVIAAEPDASRVTRRLLLSIGEAGLTTAQQDERLRAILAANAAYEDLCDLLHGRNPYRNPPGADISNWEAAVGRLEAALASNESDLV